MIVDVHGRPAYCYTGGKPFNAGQPSAVFIHGALNDHSVWSLQTRYLAHHGWNVLAPDLPGHGRSAGPALGSVAAMAAWMLALLDAARLEQAALIGHSMGALIALESAYQAPARVSHLAMLGAAYPMKVAPALLQAARHNEAQAIDMVTIWSHSSIAQKPSFPGPGCYTTGGSQRLMQRLARQNPEQLLYTDFFACNAYANGELAARSVNCPALLLLGTQDMMTPPRASAVLSAALGQAKVVRVSAGHALMQEQPDAVLDALVDFLTQ